ncbi:MAG: DUF3090 family protein [Anaerolineaceae bacterium]|nr:MAG: DUF3090 family protein [Anaerolineaceae bacterium]
MPNVEVEIDPADFITIGTVGPKGRRVFYLQAGSGAQLVSLVIEKEQSWALSEAISELVDDIDERLSDDTSDMPYNQEEMDLREPIEPMFRVSQMGLGYDEERDKVVLVAQELVLGAGGEPQDIEDDDPFGVDDPAERPGVVRVWCTRAQMRALSQHAIQTVQSGRADPRQNGRLVYYWT